MTKNLVVVTAGLSQPSSTRLLADRLTTATVDRLRESSASELGEKTDAGTDGGTGVNLTVIELRDLAHDITNNLVTGFASPKLQEALDALADADGLIAVTPIFTTSYSGLFKSFVDIIDTAALTDLPVLIGATGGTERHSLALDYAMRPLLSYLHAVVVPTAVYAASSDWGSDTGLSDRIARAAGELAPLVRESDRSGRVRDPFELPAGFSPVGAFSAQ